MDKNIFFRIREGEDYIQLIQLLKATNVADSGAEAQMMVINNQVTLNGSIEQRKRAKVRCGDIVTILGFIINVTD